MTVAPALMQVETDTRSPGTTRSRLRTAAHKLTSCGEFTRRSEALVADGGRLEVQALGAWLQLWVGHARVDGTIFLTSSEVADFLGVTVPTWLRWARLLTDAELLAPHGRTYLVPAPAAMEGCLPGHRAPGGWRSLHRATFVALVDRLAQQGVAGPKRAGALGLFAVVLLRHTYGRAGVDVVQVAALPALYELLDRGTVSAYLELLEGVLERPLRGRLSYVGRQLLEHPWEAVVSPWARVQEPDAEGSFPPSHACSSRSGTPVGQDPTPGRAIGTFVDLLTQLDRRAPGAAAAIARHRLAKALLRSAVLETGCDAEGLAYELTRSSLTNARDLAAVLGSRVPDAVDALRLRTLLNDQQTRAERQAYAIQERRQFLAAQQAQSLRESHSARDFEQDLTAQLQSPTLVVAHDELLAAVATAYGRPAGGPLVAGTARAAVLQELSTSTTGGSSHPRKGQELDVETLLPAVVRATARLIAEGNAHVC